MVGPTPMSVQSCESLAVGHRHYVSFFHTLVVSVSVFCNKIFFRIDFHYFFNSDGSLYLGMTKVGAMSRSDTIDTYNG